MADDAGASMAVRSGVDAGSSRVVSRRPRTRRRGVLAQRWRRRDRRRGRRCFVIVASEVAGSRHLSREVKHFGDAVEEWGSGLAVAAHDELVALLRAEGHATPWLRVYADNPRGRAFYDKLGWTDTGERSRGPDAAARRADDLRAASRKRRNRS